MYLLRGLARRQACLSDVLRALRYLRSARGYFLDLPGDRVRHCPLGLHRLSDSERNIVDLRDNLASSMDGVDGFSYCQLNPYDLLADLLRCVCCLTCQLFHFRCHDRKTTSGVPGPGDFDGGVQGEPIRSQAL